MLNITAQRKEETESKQGNYLRRELRVGNYARGVQLPGDIKESDIPKMPAAKEDPDRSRLKQAARRNELAEVSLQ